MKYVVTGRVQPERAAISFGRVHLQFSESGSADVSCDASQVTVVLDLPSLDGWISAKIVADEVANIMVGALGFSLGSGYTVEMIQVSEEDGTPHVFGVRPTGATTEETLGFDDHNLAFNRAFHLAGRNVFFRLALRDFLRAMSDVTDCATYCYRAIESVKAAFVLKTGLDRWDEMHTALGTSRDEVTAMVKQYADPVRHGNWVNAKPTDSLIRWQMLKLTRDILARYLELEQPAT